MTAKPIPYGRQHITDEDIRAVIETLKSDYLTQGPKIKEFETKFAGYVGAQVCRSRKQCHFRTAPFCYGSGRKARR